MDERTQSKRECSWQMVLVLFGFLLAFTANVVAQAGTQASITGVVTDESGAIVVAAHITATNVDTGAQAKTESNSEGVFDILALPIGSYRLTVEAPGFKKWENAQVQLTIGSKVRVSPTLSVGAVQEILSVTDTGAAIQTESANVGTVVQLEQIRELPLATRNPLALIGLVPGMRYESTAGATGERATFVQGNGMRDNKTAFQLDGLTTNEAMDQGGTAVPNVDTIAEFKVETLNSGAEMGLDPTQVLIVTKSGTNQFHGTADEFVQNDMFNAYNAFANKAAAKPRVRRNLFGATLGGPILRNRTFFFGSFQGTVVHNAALLNEPAVPKAFETGDFSSLLPGTVITDPTTGTPFPGNIIPTNRIDSAANYFIPLLVTPNAPGNRYIANIGTSDDTWEYLARVDHQITPTQRLYGHFEYVREPTQQPGYSAAPSTLGSNLVSQHNDGGNYTWAVTQHLLITATGGIMKSKQSYSNPLLGKQNDDVLAGIQGIPSAGREKWIGPPQIGISNFQGVSFAGGYGVPGQLWGSNYTGKGSVTYVRGSHEINAGADYGDRHTFAAHGSAAASGLFGFNGQYSGFSFADYLLGYTSNSTLNDPLLAFGESSAPYLGVYGQDHWKISRKISLSLGVRFDHWYGHHCYKDLCSIWSPTDGKVVVAADGSGKPNFTTFSTSQALANQTAGLWETSTQAGYPEGLYDANSNWSPRLGITYRPFANSDLVFRGGYGWYYNNLTGNHVASEINMPTWTVYGQNFSVASKQKWKTVWAAGPNAASNFATYSPLVNVAPVRNQEWNAALQIPLPFKTSLAVTYVGVLIPNEISAQQNNVATVGPHVNIQADQPHPLFSSIETFGNQGRFWYNGLQTFLEHRFNTGLNFTFAYTFSRSMDFNSSEGEYDAPLVFSPAWYNRHRTSNDYRHLESATFVWDVPFGRGQRFGNSANRIVDTVLGGWEASMSQTARTGAPLAVYNTNGNLGNGYTSRANQVGNPHAANPTAAQWFNQAAFQAAPLYTFGNASFGVMEGPGFFQLDSGLSKKFSVREKNYFQFRWEAFNLFNNVNLDAPDTNVTDANFGKIFGASTSRYMQFGLKFVF